MALHFKKYVGDSIPHIRPGYCYVTRSNDDGSFINQRVALSDVIQPCDDGFVPHTLRDNPSMMVSTPFDITSTEMQEDNLDLLLDEIRYSESNESINDVSNK